VTPRLDRWLRLLAKQRDTERDQERADTSNLNRHERRKAAALARRKKKGK
jgi:hypothetical protein